MMTLTVLQQHFCVEYFSFGEFSFHIFFVLFPYESVIVIFELFLFFESDDSSWGGIQVHVPGIFPIF